MTAKPPSPALSCDYDPNALPVAIARQRILAGIMPLAADAVEQLSLLQTLDRVLAEDIIAPINVPPHANSAMDGYALASANLPSKHIIVLKVVGSSFAGHPFQGQCGEGECVRIMTGAVMPAGLDTVIPQETVVCLADQQIQIDGNFHPGDNVRGVGEDMQQGQTVLLRGRRIGAAELGLLASLGITQLKVYRRLKVAFFSTGDELRSIDQPLLQGEIYDSNRYSLFGLLRQLDCELLDLGVVRDDPAQLRAVLVQAIPTCDAIIATGGVSVGEADFVRQILAELGSIALWKVAIKPGRPLTFGHLQNTVFFGLPGNPVAVMVGFNLFVQPALQCLAGETPSQPLLLKARTTDKLKKRPGRAEYQRGILSQDAEGQLTVCKTGAQGSGMLLSMSRANCFIVLSSEQSLVEVGEEVTVQSFTGYLSQ